MRDKYLDLTREGKKLWNLNVTVIPIINGALGTATKRLVQGQEDLEINYNIVEIGHNTKNSTEGDLLLHRLQWKTIR